MDSGRRALKNAKAAPNVLFFFSFRSLLHASRKLAKRNEIPIFLGHFPLSAGEGGRERGPVTASAAKSRCENGAHLPPVLKKQKLIVSALKVTQPKPE